MEKATMMFSLFFSISSIINFFYLPEAIVILLTSLGLIGLPSISITFKRCSSTLNLSGQAETTPACASLNL